MLLPAANGLVPVKAVKAAPLKLAETFAEGMLSPDPSVSAAAGPVKYAYSVTVPHRTGSTQVVVILTGVFPFEMPLRRRAKLTAPGAAVIVMALLRDALRFTVEILEFSWASALDGIKTRIDAAKTRDNPFPIPNLIFRVSLC
jgi:hypothetical protein